MLVNEFYIIALTFIAAGIAAISQYILKRSVHKFEFGIKGVISLIKNKYLILGIGIYLVSLIFYLVALSSGELSFVYPTFASTFIFIFLISHFKLNEKMNMHRLLGLIFIILGIFIVALTY
ncbi:MAG: hypothetical protein ACP5M9_02860 [Candidatus Micrarchaeia archaeon]